MVKGKTAHVLLRSVVDQDVQPAKLLHRLLNHLLGSLQLQGTNENANLTKQRLLFKLQEDGQGEDGH
jgi:hypothetical protein